MILCDLCGHHKSLVPPCFVNQLLDRFAWSVSDRSRSNVSSFDGRHAQEKGRRRHAREALARGPPLSPHCRSQSPRSAERRSVIHVSGRFCWVKVNGQWLYKTRQIVTGRNNHPGRWMLWRPTAVPRSLQPCAPQNPSAGEYVETRGCCPAEDRCTIVPCYTSFDPRGRK